ncbi:hypothetical protein F4678DRAFT_484045 [Xylaria arbuscula]|nr:hypothetical protein F4678DRAFT_484045 [Xylaria arbuscula]
MDQEEQAIPLLGSRRSQPESNTVRRDRDIQFEIEQEPINSDHPSPEIATSRNAVEYFFARDSIEVATRRSQHKKTPPVSEARAVRERPKRGWLKGTWDKIKAPFARRFTRKGKIKHAIAKIETQMDQLNNNIEEMNYGRALSFDLLGDIQVELREAVNGLMSEKEGDLEALNREFENIKLRERIGGVSPKRKYYGRYLEPPKEPGLLTPEERDEITPLLPAFRAQNAEYTRSRRDLADGNVGDRVSL